MPSPTLLLHLDDGPTCEQRTALAIDLARRHGAHLTALAATGSIPISAVAGPGLLGVDTLTPALAHLRLQAARRAAAFREQARAAGLEACEVLIDEDGDAEALVRLSRSADLLVVGQADPADRNAGSNRRMVEDVVLQSARPVLLIPFAGRFDRVGADVLVAWDDRREAARAIADALPLLRESQRVRIVRCATPLDDGSESARESLAALQRWLGRHGVAASAHTITTDVDPGNALLSRAAEWGCDLVVMGAYGHARWAERILGGVTRTMLETMTVPVLMSR
ncbi:universal stress protein [Rhizobacter sp. LjRoot28]|uniref:universal stress protein n=1 Tax=Rhizobacter sp. LjRoot28 TaxID=3342309 RepID=UPI003ECDE2E8